MGRRLDWKLLSYIIFFPLRSFWVAINLLWFLIRGKIPLTRNWGCQLLAMMEELIADEHQWEESKNRNNAHIRIHKQPVWRCCRASEKPELGPQSSGMKSSLTWAHHFACGDTLRAWVIFKLGGVREWGQMLRGYKFSRTSSDSMGCNTQK